MDEREEEDHSRVHDRREHEHLENDKLVSKKEVHEVRD